MKVDKQGSYWCSSQQGTHSITRQQLTKVYRSVVPFLLILFGGVLLITYLPFLTLALVR